MALEVRDTLLWFRFAAMERQTSQLGQPSNKEHLLDFLSHVDAGTSAGQVSAVFSDQITATTNYDLSGSLVSKLDGSVVTFTELVGIFCVNASQTPGEAWDIGGGSDGAGTSAIVTWLSTTASKLRVGPGGFAAIYDPIDAYPVTAGSADVLRFEPAAGAPTLKLFLLGRVAA